VNQFLDHGGWTHPRSLRRELTHVPLIVRLPDRFGPTAAASRGRRVDEPVSLVDVFPTLLGLVHVECPEVDDRFLFGADVSDLFVPPTNGTQPVVRRGRPILGELAYVNDVIDTLREDRWLYSRLRAANGVVHQFLFDTVTDPGEQNDVASAHPELIATFGETIDAILRGLESTSLEAAEHEIDADSADHLRAIGYLGGK
jgi:arylsulfatase A-like enzyme